MTDLPEELNQIEEMLYHVKPQGRVLVGGLGLGIVAKRLTEIIGVKQVVVVEKAKEIINSAPTVPTKPSAPISRIISPTLLQFLMTILC